MLFIAGLSDSEIDDFIDLAFKLFGDFTQTGGIYQNVVKIMKETNSQLALPLKLVQGVLVLMGTIFAKLGNLVKSTLPKLLNILLNISAHIVDLLEKRDEFEAKHVTQFKNLRTIG